MNERRSQEAQLSTLRDQVARLERERDEWEEAAKHNLSRRLSALVERNAARKELAALKAAPLDVEKVMRLAEEYASADVCCVWSAGTSGWHENYRIKIAAREALRQELTKEAK